MRPPNAVVVAALLVAAALQLSAQQPIPTSPAVVASGRARPVRPLLPGTRPGIISIIQGNALTSTNASLPDSVVRLRDARFGRIVDTQLTDKAGLFAFKVLDPGSYVIEIVSRADSTVLAASQLINVNAGEALSAVVKLPFQPAAFAGVLEPTTSEIAAVTAVAASSGIMSATITRQAEPVSP
jgi:hypothetical protein